MTESEYMETLMRTLHELGTNSSIAEKLDMLFPDLTDEVKMRISILVFLMDENNINDMMKELGIV